MAPVKAKPLPRGYRNRNPGNLRKSSDKWQGLAAEQPDDEFFTFESDVMGIRALAVTLRTYFDRYGLDTITEILNRWAPPKGRDPISGRNYTQNTAAYVQAVSESMKRAPRERLDLFTYADLEPLVRAIIRHELGDPRAYGRKEWYSQDVIDAALLRAGIKRPQAPVVKDTQATATGAAAAGATAAGTGATIAYVELREAGRELRDAGKASEALGVTVAGVGLTIVAVGVLAYTVWKKRKIRAQ